MKIAFYTPLIDVRGTCVSLYDYAHYNEILLGNESIIITPLSKNHDAIAIYKFIKRFRVFFYDTWDNVESRLLSENCDILYCIKYGKNDGILSNNIKTVIHCVFSMEEPHGDVYAAVSDTLAKKFNQTLFVPHMISLSPSITQENMRNLLGIPTDALVFGRHGGVDTFDLDIVKEAIVKVVNNNTNIYFLFVNTPCFVSHRQVIHLDKIIDSCEKNTFISTCDAMIHGQSLGETFGIAIGEFSVNNKPIIAYNGPVWNDHYKNILGDNAFWYTNTDECVNILETFDKNTSKNINCYHEYTPDKVMSKFKQVFLD